VKDLSRAGQLLAEIEPGLEAILPEFEALVHEQGA
jgi:hypothetical protein